MALYSSNQTWHELSFFTPGPWHNWQSYLFISIIKNSDLFVEFMSFLSTTKSDHIPLKQHRFIKIQNLQLLISKIHSQRVASAICSAMENFILFVSSCATIFLVLQALVVVVQFSFLLSITRMPYTLVYLKT